MPKDRITTQTVFEFIGILTVVGLITLGGYKAYRWVNRPPAPPPELDDPTTSTNELVETEKEAAAEVKSREEAACLNFLTYYTVLNTGRPTRDNIVRFDDLSRCRLLRELVTHSHIEHETMPISAEAKEAVLKFCDEADQHVMQYDIHLRTQAGETGRRLLHAVTSKQAAVSGCAGSTVGGSVGAGLAAVPGGVLAPVGGAIGTLIGASFGHVVGATYAWSEYGKDLTAEHAATFVPISANYFHLREKLLASLEEKARHVGARLGYRDVTTFAEAMQRSESESVLNLAKRFGGFYPFQIAAAKINIDRGSFAEAKKCAVTANLFPFQPPMEQREIWFVRGLANLYRDDVAEAARCFSEAVNVPNAGSPSYNLLGYHCLALCSKRKLSTEDYVNIQSNIRWMEEMLCSRAQDDIVPGDAHLLALVKRCVSSTRSDVPVARLQEQFETFSAAAEPILETDRGPLFLSLIRRIPVIKASPPLRESFKMRVSLMYDPDPWMNDYSIVNNGPLSLPTGTSIKLVVTISGRETETTETVLERELRPGKTFFIAQFPGGNADSQSVELTIVSGLDRLVGQFKNLSLKEGALVQLIPEAESI